MSKTGEYSDRRRTKASVSAGCDRWCCREQFRSRGTETWGNGDPRADDSLRHLVAKQSPELEGEAEEESRLEVGI